MHGVEFSHPFGGANAVFERIFNRRAETGGASETVLQSGYAPTEALHGHLGARLPDARRRRRPRPLALAVLHRAVGAARLASLRRPIDGWRDGRTNPAYLDEHELRAAGRLKQLRLEPE